VSSAVISDRRNLRWPPGVRMNPRRPEFAHRVTVLGFTPNSWATCVGVSSSLAGSIGCRVASVSRWVQVLGMSPAVSGEVSTAATGRCRAGPWPFGLLEGVDPARPAPRPPMTVTLACPCCVCGNGHGKHQGVSGVVAEHIREPFCGSRLVCLSIGYRHRRHEGRKAQCRKRRPLARCGSGTQRCRRCQVVSCGLWADEHRPT